MKGLFKYNLTDGLRHPVDDYRHLSRGEISHLFAKWREASGDQSLPKVKRQHVGCNATTCPNGKCNATGECQDNLFQQHRKQHAQDGQG